MYLFVTGFPVTVLAHRIPARSFLIPAVSRMLITVCLRVTHNPLRVMGERREHDFGLPFPAPIASPALQLPFLL